MGIAESQHVQARQMLGELSGKCGQESWYRWGYFISNDTTFYEIQPAFENNAKSIQDGIAFFIGQGAVFSLLPRIGASLLPVVADINPAVPAFAEVVQSAILTCNHPTEAIDTVLDSVATNQKAQYPFSTADDIRERLENEQFSFDGLHWSLPENFEDVQAALIRSPIIPVVADVSSESFIIRLQAIQAITDLSITFANITNVAEYRKSHYGLDSQFLRQIPLAERALVLFSSEKNHLPGTSYPACRLAVGRQNLEKALAQLDAIPEQQVNYKRKIDLNELVWDN